MANTTVTTGGAERKRQEQMQKLERLYRRGQIDQAEYYRLKKAIFGEQPSVDELGQRFAERHPGLAGMVLPSADDAHLDEPEDKADTVTVALIIKDPINRMRYKVGCDIPGRVWQEAMEVDREAFVRMVVDTLAQEIARTGGRSNVQF